MLNAEQVSREWSLTDTIIFDDGYDHRSLSLSLSLALSLSLSLSHTHTHTHTHPHTHTHTQRRDGRHPPTQKHE